MTDTNGPDPDNQTRREIQNAYERALIAGPGINLGQWAARGDWALMTQESRDRAGHEALDRIDRVLADVRRVRNELADALGEPTTTAAGTAEADDWVTGKARAKLAADCVLFARDREGQMHVLLIQRDPADKSDPFRGYWALPGGGMDLGETFAATAVRELAEETGVILNLDRERLLSIDVFDALDRDPRARVISKAFAVLLSRPLTAYHAKAGSDAYKLAWLPVDDAGRLTDDVTLAFDHAAVIAAAATRLRQIIVDPATPGLAARLAKAREEVQLTAGLPPSTRWSELSDTEHALATLDAENWLRALAAISKEG